MFDTLLDTLVGLERFATDADLGAAVDALVLDNAGCTRFRLAAAALVRVDDEVPEQLPAERVEILLELGVAGALATGDVSRAEVRTLLGNPGQLEEFQSRALSDDTYFSRRIVEDIFCENLLQVLGQHTERGAEVLPLAIGARQLPRRARQAADTLPPWLVLERPGAPGDSLRAAPAACRLRLDDVQRRLGYLHFSLEGAGGKRARLFLVAPEDLGELRRYLGRDVLTYEDLKEKVFAYLPFRRSADEREQYARCPVPPGTRVIPCFLALVE